MSEVLAIGVDVAVGRGARTALVALCGPEVVANIQWRGAPPTTEAVSTILALADAHDLGTACAAVEGAWLGANTQTALSLAEEAGGWRRLLEAVGVGHVEVVQPDRWRSVLGRCGRSRPARKAAAALLARATWGAEVAAELGEHGCEAACMVLWARREAQERQACLALAGRAGAALRAAMQGGSRARASALPPLARRKGRA